MDIQKYLLLLIFFFIVTSFGYAFTKRILKENRIICLIPLSICFGSSFFVILLHLLSLIFGIKLSTYISLFLIFVGTLFILLKYKTTTKLVLNLSVFQFILLSLFSCIVAALTFWHLIIFGTYDPLYQSIEVMIKNSYPPHHPYNSEMIVSYHFGVILYACALRVFSSIDVWNSFIPIQTIFAFVTPFTIFCLLFSSTKNYIQSFIGSVIGCFCANLTSFKLLMLLPQVNNYDFFSNAHKTLVTMNESGFAISTSKALVSPNLSVAIPLSILLFYLCTRENANGKRYCSVILFVTAFLFFSYESFYVPVLISVFLYYFFFFILSKDKPKQLITSILIIASLLLGPFLVGSVFVNNVRGISNLLYFHPKLYTYSWSGILNQFYPNEWFGKNMVLSNGDGCQFYKIPLLSKYFFVELGLPFIILPIIMIWLFFKKNLILIFFFLSGLISFMFPFLISYLPREIEVLRFFIYARYIFSILFGAFLGWSLTVKLPYLVTNTYRLILIIVIFLQILPGIVWFIPRKIAEYDYRYSQIPNLDKKALSWLSKKVKPGDRGLGPTNIPHAQFELINIASVFGITGDPKVLFASETRKTALTTLNPCLLKELKVRWIFLNNDLLTVVPKEMIENLKNEKLLFLRYKCKDDKDTKKIYEFIPKNVDRYCTNKTYEWVLGRMYDGKFIQLIDSDSMLKIAFNDKEIALNTLEQLKKRLDPKEAYWYRVEAIKI